MEVKCFCGEPLLVFNNNKLDVRGKIYTTMNGETVIKCPKCKNEVLLDELADQMDKINVTNFIDLINDLKTKIKDEDVICDIVDLLSFKYGINPDRVNGKYCDICGEKLTETVGRLICPKHGARPRAIMRAFTINDVLNELKKTLQK